MSKTTPRYRSVDVSGVNVFYREAGAPDAPVLLLLHGFPTSSHMYRNLIPLLAEQYRVIAPDLPGFGETRVSAEAEFDYTFDNLAQVMEGFLDKLALDRFALFVFDYGAPVGFRLATARPGSVSAIISQNGNAYDEGLTEGWDPIKAYWQNDTRENRDALRGFLAAETTRFQYTEGVPEDRLERISPDALAHDQAILDRDPEIQLDLFRDYASNVALYPLWQAYLAEHQPPLLAVWGQNDPFFAPDGARAFRRDVPGAEIHFFETGHFALETHLEEITAKVLAFLADRRHLKVAA